MSNLPSANAIMFSVPFPSSANLPQHFAANRPPARVFWNSAKLGPGQTPAKKGQKKHPGANAIMSSVGFPSSANLAHNILLQTAPLKVPVEPSYVKFAKGTPKKKARVFWNSAKLEEQCHQGKLLQKERPEKTPWRECHHVLTRGTTSARFLQVPT